MVVRYLLWPGVWPSVCSSHTGTVSKPLNRSTWFSTDGLFSADPTLYCQRIRVRANKNTSFWNIIQNSQLNVGRFRFLGTTRRPSQFPKCCRRLSSPSLVYHVSSLNVHTFVYNTLDVTQSVARTASDWRAEPCVSRQQFVERLHYHCLHHRCHDHQQQQHYQQYTRDVLSEQVVSLAILVIFLWRALLYM